MTQTHGNYILDQYEIVFVVFDIVRNTCFLSTKSLCLSVCADNCLECLDAATCNLCVDGYALDVTGCTAGMTKKFPGEEIVPF